MPRYRVKLNIGFGNAFTDITVTGLAGGNLVFLSLGILYPGVIDIVFAG